jgi:uncharacterized protein (DUF305 family)
LDYPHQVLTQRGTVLLGVAIAAAGCRSGGGATAPIVLPSSPGRPSAVITAERAADLATIGHTDADVRFMQAMLAHHAQALEMTRLLRSRTERPDMRLLAERIDASQLDEMTFMRQWLDARGEQVPGEHAHHTGAPMPGMLSADEMAALAAARGPAFDRLFLESMITHHLGALEMVRELFAAAGAGQDAEIFSFASDVDADQRIEIRRMRAMLLELP